MTQVQNTKHPRGMPIKKWYNNNTTAHRSVGRSGWFCWLGSDRLGGVRSVDNSNAVRTCSVPLVGV